jgi:hypothetical protein
MSGSNLGLEVSGDRGWKKYSTRRCQSRGDLTLSSPVLPPVLVLSPGRMEVSWRLTCLHQYSLLPGSFVVLFLSYAG